MSSSLLLWLFQRLPEALASASLAVVILTGRLDWKKIFITGLLFAAAVYLVRLLPLAFGVHFIILMIILALLLSLQLKISFSKCLFTALAVGIILAIFESVFIYLLMILTGIAVEPTMEELHTRIVFGWPHIIAIFLLALAAKKWKFFRFLKKGKD